MNASPATRRGSASCKSAAAAASSPAKSSQETWTTPRSIIDDMISTGGTMLRAAEACKQRGAKAVYAMATHGLFNKGAEAMLATLRSTGRS